MIGDNHLFQTASTPSGRRTAARARCPRTCRLLPRPPIHRNMHRTRCRA